MREMFYPEKVVVVGVSTRAENMGKNILRNLALFGTQSELRKLIKATGYPVFGAIEEAVQGLAIQRDYWRNREGLGL